MIKFALRHNLIYPFQLIIWNFIRLLLTELIKKKFFFSNSLLYTFLMFLGELIAGIIFYFYQKRFNKKNKIEKKEQYFMSIKLLTKEDDEDEDFFVPFDGRIKILILIFFSAFFDAIQFLLWTKYLKKFINVSSTINTRLSGISTISSSLFYVFVLKLPIFKHHIFSLIIIGICSFLMILFEFLFLDVNIFLTYEDFIICLLLVFVINILVSSLDSIEKYLFEYDYMNPFVVLMYEGFFGLIICSIFLSAENYFNDATDVYKKCSGGDFTFFIFLLIFYVILCGIKNVFKMVTIKLYSPMAKSLTDYFLNPIYLSYNFGLKADFMTKGSRNIPYFIVNLILSFIISFFGCVYNEFIVLFFCGLERNTHDQISKRADEHVLSELLSMDESSNEDTNSEANSLY